MCSDLLFQSAFLPFSWLYRNMDTSLDDYYFSAMRKYSRCYRQAFWILSADQYGCIHVIYRVNFIVCTFLNFPKKSYCHKEVWSRTQKIKSHKYRLILNQFFQDYPKEIEEKSNHKDNNAVKILSKYLNRLFIKKYVREL